MSGKPVVAHPPRSERRISGGSGGHLLVFFLVPGILGVLYALGIGTCPMRLATGIPCPGCGLTRATVALLHLDFGTMLRMHPLSPVVLPLVAWIWGRMFLTGIGVIPLHRPSLLSRVPSRVWMVGLAIVWIVWAIRLAFGMHPDLG